MRRTQVLGKPFGRLVHCRSAVKTITTCGHFNTTELTEGRIHPSHKQLFHSSSQQHQDLRRFLEEIGTDPKEARYWLRQFQTHESSSDQPFAVVQVDSEIMRDETMLVKLSSCLAFLHRNGMPVIAVHGLERLPCDPCTSDPRQRRAKLIQENIELVDLLEKHGSRARPFMNSGHVLSVLELENPGDAFHGTIDQVDVKPLQQCLRSGHIPVLTAVGESPSGQVLCVDATEAAIRIADILQPMKVMFLNTTGGLVDRQGNVLGNVNVADDLEDLLQQPWHTNKTVKQVISISNLLNTLPEYSSAVITSADSLITELFTHKGSGTMFLRPEKIERHHTLATVDVEKLKDLLIKSFDRPLNAEYFLSLKNRLHTLYVTVSYSAAAVITSEGGVDGVHYLDKFTVGRKSQGLGTSDNLWKKIHEDFSSLFWRSRVTNRINPWYFIRCDGSFMSGEWIVFWYGVSDHSLTHKLVEHGKMLPSSFDPVAPRSKAQLVARLRKAVAGNSSTTTSKAQTGGKSSRVRKAKTCSSHSTATRTGTVVPYAQPATPAHSAQSDDDPSSSLDKLFDDSGDATAHTAEQSALSPVQRAAIEVIVMELVSNAFAAFHSPEHSAVPP